MNKFLISFLLLLGFTSTGFTQNTGTTNKSLPVEATADDLQINSDENSAVFTGNAKVVQGILNLQAKKITVFFDTNADNIKSVNAIGNVSFTNGPETAKANSASFNVDTQIITFSGNVILKQDKNVLAGDQLTYNISNKHSKMTGNVKSVFTPN